jgi:TM2 domain-containing membrane protein YozV
MKGNVLDYSVQNNQGVISGADGGRYTFAGAEWRGDTAPARGMTVDFEAQGSSAVAVYRALSNSESAGGTESKSRVTAGVLALVLGGLGIHKFYLGYTGPGLVFLLVNTIGWIVTIFLLALPNIALGIIAMVEGILYLTKTDEEFRQTYVVGKRPWF